MERPIGVIDSGVGGLTVFHEMMRQLPREKLIYLGDTKRCPYGPRPKEEVQQFTWEMVHFLLKQDIKLLVIACNTATAYTIDELKRVLDIPIIGVIQPGARAAIKATKNLQVGIIGTEGTVKSGAYPDALQKINPEIAVEALACPAFVPMVEKGVFEGEKVREIVTEAFRPLKEKNQLDTLILGCTHYPLLRPVIEDVIGSAVTVISSSEETARETSAVLEINQLQNKISHQPIHEIFSTGDLELFHTIAKKIFGKEKLQKLEMKTAVL